MFCPKNDTFEIPWFNHGVSLCVMETLSSSVSAGFLLVFGTIQACLYWKYATSIVEAVNAAPRSKLYSLQRFLLVFVPVVASVRYMLQSYFYEESAVYGYMVRISMGYIISLLESIVINWPLLLALPQLLSLALTWVSYLFAIALIQQERNNQLPVAPVRGHGIVLLVFFTMIFIAENLTFINVRHEDWWFHFRE